MEHIDEKILKILYKEERLQQSIFEGQVKIGGQTYEFKERPFYDSRVLLHVPEDFKEMPRQQRELKYPSAQRPEIILTDEATGSINIMLNRIDSPLGEEQVKELKDGMMSILKKVNPSNIFFTDGVEIINDKNIGYFEFKSSALDSFIYNLMFFFELDGKTVMGTFCCKYEDYGDWREIAFQMMKSVRVIKLFIKKGI